MLPQRYRLRQSADIKRVRQQGKSWRHPLVILLVQANVEEVSRFSFVASRRIGNAVTRNLMKRRLRQIVRCHLDEVEAGWDCLVIVRHKMTKATFAEVETAVLQLFTRANLLSGNFGEGGDFTEESSA